MAMKAQGGRMVAIGNSTTISDSERMGIQQARQDIIKAIDTLKRLQSEAQRAGSSRSQQYARALAALATANEATDRARSMSGR